MKTAFELISSIIITIGSTSLFVLFLAKWFGGVLANKILEKDRAEYSKMLEYYKTEIEKSKFLFLKYSEQQFIFYNELWSSLCELKNVCEDLWSKASIQKLKIFSEQLYSTKIKLEKNALIVEDDHYLKLLNIINKFKELEIGKLKIVELKNKQLRLFDSYSINELAIKKITESNRQIKLDYEELIIQVMTTFRNQIKGNLIKF
jgi:hypothetical protein